MRQVFFHYNQWIFVDSSGRQWYKSYRIDMELSAFMGHSPAKIDEKGRLKVPATFRKIMADRYGDECFITSKDGESALVYPMPVWLEFQAKLAKVPSTSMAKIKLLERVNYFGQVGTIDAQGRVLVPAVLREVAGIAEDVVVLGSQDHLIVWNEQKMKKRLEDTPLTAEDYKELELHGV